MLIFVGALLAPVAVFSMLGLWDELNILTFLFTTTILAAGYFVAIFMTKYAKFPRANILNSKIYRHSRIRTTSERRQLKICK